MERYELATWQIPPVGHTVPSESQTTLPEPPMLEYGQLLLAMQIVLSALPPFGVVWQQTCPTAQSLEPSQVSVQLAPAVPQAGGVVTGATNEQPCTAGQVRLPQVTDPAVATVAKLRHCPPAQPVEQSVLESVPLLVHVNRVVQSKLAHLVLPEYQSRSPSLQSPEFGAYPDTVLPGHSDVVAPSGFPYPSPSTSRQKVTISLLHGPSCLLTQFAVPPQLPQGMDAPSLFDQSVVDFVGLQIRQFPEVSPMARNPPPIQQPDAHPPPLQTF